MKAQLPIELSSMPVMDLRKERDLVWYEGPLLSVFRSATTREPYLYLWCDRDDDFNRWAVFRTAELDLINYENRTKTLRDLVLSCPERLLFFVDLDDDGELNRVYFCPLSEVPKEYLPGLKSFFNPDLAAVPFNEGVGPYNILVHEQLDENELGLIPRRFRQVYTFLHLLGEDGLPTRSRPFDSYRFRGGFVVNTFYDELRKMVEDENKASLRAVNYSSPGYMRWELYRPTAGKVRETVRAFSEHSATLRETYVYIHDWLLGQGDEEEPSEKSEASVREAVIELAAALGHVDGKKLLELTQSVQNAAHIIAIHFRKIEDLARYQASNRITLL